MPRNSPGKQPTVKSEQSRLLWVQTGSHHVPTVDDWDPKAQPLVEALLAIVSSGATVVLRPGSGGRSIGIAIWEGDHRHAPSWIYDTEEMDAWATQIIRLSMGAAENAAD